MFHRRYTNRIAGGVRCANADLPDTRCRCFLATDRLASLAAAIRARASCYRTAPGYTLDQSSLPAPLAAEFEARFNSDARSIHDRAHGIIVKVAITALDISATGVRAHIAARRSARYLLPDIVLDYIRANTLYQDER